MRDGGREGADGSTARRVRVMNYKLVVYLHFFKRPFSIRERIYLTSYKGFFRKDSALL